MERDEIPMPVCQLSVNNLEIVKKILHFQLVCKNSLRYEGVYAGKDCGSLMYFTVT